MKNFGKIISLVLLLSLIVSVFAVLPAFAADETESGGSGEGINTLYDMDKLTVDSITPANSEAGVKVFRDEEGYWVTDFSTYNADQPSGLDAWFGIYLDEIAVQDSEEGSYVVHETTDAEGNVTAQFTAEGGTGVKRNTKYLILDFDVSTTSTFLRDVYFNIRHTDAAATDYNASKVVNIDTDGDGTTEKYTVGTKVSPLSPSIRQSTYGWYANVTDASVTSRYPIDDYHKEWMNVTFIYDYSERVAYDGGVDRSHWAIHVFFDGVYAGRITTISEEAARIWFFRFSFGKPTSEGTTARWKNFTLKQVSTDYTGILDNTDIKAINLNDIDELAYTQENCPDEKVIATITRGTTVTPYTSVYDFDSELQPGDTLTLYADINRTFVIQDDKVEGTVGVTVVDNGFTAPTFVEMDLETIGWVMRDYYTGEVKKSGTQTLPETVDAAYVDTDFWGAYANDASRIITFYKDYSLVSGSSSVGFYGYHVIFDLNGNTMNVLPSTAHITCSKSAAARPVFKDGTIYYNPINTKYNFQFINESTVGYAMLFENVNLTIASGTWIDQRGGMVYYKDSTITVIANSTPPTFMSTKSDYGRYAYCIFDNCEYTDNTANAIAVKNVSNKYNSMSNYVIARNGSDITCAENFVLSAVYYTADDTVKINYVNVGVFDSNISCTRLLRHGGSLTDATKFSFNADINVVNSNVSTYRALKITGSRPTASSVYAIDTYICNSKFLINPSGSFVDRKSGNTTANLTFILDEGTMLKQNKVTNAAPTGIGSNDVIYGFNNDYKVITAPVDGYTTIVMPESKIVNYTYPTASGTATIEWARDYEVNYAKFTDLKALTQSTVETYEYEWRIVDNVVTEKAIPTFALRGNLTLFSDLYFNLFVENKYSEIVTADSIKVLTSTGELELGKDYVVTPYNDGETDFFKVQIRGINPNEIDTVFTLVIDLDGEAGDVVAEKSVSVLEYITMMLNDGKTDCDGVMASIVDYAIEAYKFTSVEVPEALGALVDADEYLAVEEATSDITAVNTLDGIFSDVALNLTADFTFTFTLDDASKAGEAVRIIYGDSEINTVVQPDGSISFAVKANKMTETFNIFISDVDCGQYNLKAYVDAVDLAVADAIWQYVVEATAYDKAA